MTGNVHKKPPKPVKIKMPGPLTVADTFVDEYMGIQRFWQSNLRSTKSGSTSLANAGADIFKLTNPLCPLSGKAIEFGVENLERPFHNCPENVTRTVHICWAIRIKLIRMIIQRLQESYFKIAEAMENFSRNGHITGRCTPL
ncbi:MAG: hypothetical protein CM1200mP28_06010 [Deltaproteobacteria bacterium]|nr:MAG: hypothetical protein CM1200mP28_06010 [Deltaproteobacteria bacterium]